MTRANYNAVKKVAIIGTGTVGASWAAYFLSRGIEVVATDLAAGAEQRLRDVIEKAWPNLQALGLSEGASPDRITFVDRLADACSEADFIQENVTENVLLKQQVYAEIEPHISPDVIIASSTSSLLISQLQAKTIYPHRFIVAHPFNPPHLLPLVEVVGGNKTAEEVVEWAMAFYAWLGKHPIRVQKEAVGHVANRLTAALYREAVHLVAEGIASVADVDAAITNGPGLRWALMGPHLTYHLGGGPGGYAHYLAHLGPAQEERWRHLGHPTLSPPLIKELIDGVTEEVEGKTWHELAARRDKGLLGILNLLAQLTPHPPDV